MSEPHPGVTMDVGPSANVTTKTQQRIGLAITRVESYGWCVIPYGADASLGRFVSSGEAERWVRKQRWRHAVICVVYDENGETIRRFELPTRR
jgi:hypothetical protein